jgi:3-hydroxyisobutyrate dehydrogenase-like beta-hydroxyacid dehydrogenase
MLSIKTIGIIGLGEVGKAFAQGLHSKVDAIYAWDTNPEQLQACESLHIHACVSNSELCKKADLIISAVTASNTLAVAQAASMKPGQFFLDLNSASPGTKQKCAQVVEAQGAHYVEAGVMTSVPPYGIKVPMLLGGRQAKELAELLTSWTMDAKAISTEIGKASAIKMSRSIMIKGLEALVIESFTNARKYGVEDEVIATLEETFPNMDWHKQAAYFYSRVVQHGKRRAEEMREAANTVLDTGIEPLMASAIAQKQQVIADLAKNGAYVGVSKDAVDSKDWRQFADRTIDAIKAIKAQ